MVIFNSYVKLPEGSEFVSLQIGFFSSRMWIFKWAVTQGRGRLMGSWSTVDGCEIPRKPVENGGLSSHYFALWLQWLWFIGNISIVDGVYKPIYRFSSISGGAGFRWPIHSTSIGVYSLFSLRKPSGPVRELIRNSESQVVEELSSIRSKVIGINRINGCK